MLFSFSTVASLYWKYWLCGFGLSIVRLDIRFCLTVTQALFSQFLTFLSVLAETALQLFENFRILYFFFFFTKSINLF